MGLFGNKSNKVTAYFVFVGRLAESVEQAEYNLEQDFIDAHSIFETLPSILMSRFGKKVNSSYVYSSYFFEWNKNGEEYERSLILDIMENGFNAYNTYGDRKRLLDEVEKRMIYKFNVMLKDYHPSVYIFSSSGEYAMHSGIYLICFEQKVKENKLGRQISPY